MGASARRTGCMSKIPQISAENDNSAAGGSNRRRIHLREISGDTESQSETVGQELRAARLRRGDEIAQVSRALKIRKDHLEALENSRLEDLPGKTYAIGFVRSYARHLGLDAAQYVERFKREISGQADDLHREPAPIHQDDRRLRRLGQLGGLRHGQAGLQQVPAVAPGRADGLEAVVVFDRKSASGRRLRIGATADCEERDDEEVAVRAKHCVSGFEIL